MGGWAVVWPGDTLFYESFHLASFLESRRRDGDHVLYYGVQVGPGRGFSYGRTPADLTRPLVLWVDAAPRTGRRPRCRSAAS